MANELKITDIVDPSALKQLRDLKKEFKKTEKTYSSLALKLADGVKVNPKSIKELSDKSLKYNTTLKDLITTQNKLSDLQKEHESLLKRIAQQTKDNVDQILAEAKANELNAAAELKLQKTETERLKQQRMLNQEKRKAKITTEEAIALTNKEVHSINEAKEQNKLLRIAVSQVTDAEDKDNRIRQQLNGQIAKNTEYIRFNSDAYTRQKMAIGDYKNAVKAALVELKNGNNTFKNLGIVAKGFGGILKSSVSAGLSEVRIGIGSMIKGMVGAQAVISGFQKLIGLFKSGVRSIVDFEAANSKLAAILGTTSNKIKDLTADAQRLGATTKYTASEATNLQIELAKLGFSRKEILQSTEGILKFAQATGAELPEAAALAGAALRMFNADTKETERYVSAMAIATTKSALSFSYLQTAMPIVGPVAKAFNFQIEDTLALLGKLADAGFDASSAATATRNIILNLADSGGELAKALGGSVKTLPELIQGLQKLKEKNVDLATTLALTDKRSVSQFNTFLRASDSIIPLREQITGVNSELSDMADTMGYNVKGAVAGLSSAWESFMLSFYNSKGYMKDVLDFFAKGIRETARQLKSYSQLQEDADNKAVSNAQRAIVSSEVVEKHTARMQRLYKEKLNEGMKADEAALAAKDEYLEALKNKLESQNIAYQVEIEKRIKLEEDLDKMGLFYFNSSKGMSKKQLKENIETAITAAAGKKGVASITESLIEDLNKVDLKQGKVLKKTTILTDEQKKELEKNNKEFLRIQEEYQQSEIALMDEGLEKELANISFNYNKRIAAIKGNSKEEIATRRNLSEKMKDEIDNFTISYNLNKEKEYLNQKLNLAKKDSEEELHIRLELLYNQMLQEKNIAIQKGEDTTNIEKVFYAKRQQELEKFADSQNKKLQDNASFESILLNKNMEEELIALNDWYKNNLDKKEEYERRKEEITEKYGIQQAKLAVDLAKKMLETEDLSPESKLALKKQLAEAEIALAKEVSDNEIAEAERSSEAMKKKIDNVINVIQQVGDYLNQFSDLGSAIYERRIQEIEDQQEANEEAGEKEQERIEELAESGVITTEEAEAKKRAAEKKTAEKNKELEKQKADIQVRQAKFNKANSIVQAMINTASGILKTIAEVGFPAAIPLIALASATGAIQLATIMAQPIPKYAKGTKDHPGGLAIVGDGGRPETILTDKGAYITPSTPTLVDIPKRAMVIPEVIDYRNMRLRSDALILDRMNRESGDPVIVNVNNDYKNLERKMDISNQGIANLNKTLKKMVKAADFRDIERRL